MSSVSYKDLEEVRSRFAEFLVERKLRQTPERMAILEGVYHSQKHFDADELFATLREQGVSVSRATIYNTLELLIDCNLVARHQFGGKQAKYEPAFSYWQHDHLLCIDCNELFEFCDPRLQSIQEMVGDFYEMDVHQHSLTLYGRCRKTDCPNRKKSRPAAAGGG